MFLPSDPWADNPQLCDWSLLDFIHCVHMAMIRLYILLMDCGRQVYYLKIKEKISCLVHFPRKEMQHLINQEMNTHFILSILPRLQSYHCK